MSDFWQAKKVLVTGGDGFIGSHLTELLIKKGAKVAITTRSGSIINLLHLKNKLTIIKANLANLKDTLRTVKDIKVIFHLASKVAGIQYNLNHPATMFSDNVIITRNILEAAVNNNIERVLLVSSACVYPRDCTIPTPEKQGFVSDPEPTNLGYGWAKRVTELMGRIYHQEYRLKIGIVRPYNCYGPRDNFDPQFSHVIPGLLKRLFQGEDPLKVWGSGRQTRSFIFVEDLAKGMLTAIEKYPLPDPVNLGSKEEISLTDLASLLINLSGKKAQLIFDKSKPDGQPRRACDSRKAKKLLNFTAKTSLEEGLKKTIAWYKNNLLS